MAQENWGFFAIIAKNPSDNDLRLLARITASAHDPEIVRRGEWYKAPAVSKGWDERAWWAFLHKERQETGEVIVDFYLPLAEPKPSVTLKATMQGGVLRLCEEHPSVATLALPSSMELQKHPDRYTMGYHWFSGRDTD